MTSMNGTGVFLNKQGNPRPIFYLFSSFQTNITILTTNKCEKMSIQYTEPGFELTTFREHESPSTTARQGLEF